MNIMEKNAYVAYQELTWVYTYSLQVPASLWRENFCKVCKPGQGHIVLNLQ